MAVVTTGSLVKGGVVGISQGIGIAPLEIMELHAGQNPDGVLGVAVGSQVAVSQSTGGSPIQYYMGGAVNGSTWVRLGSVAAGP